jgi:hypothetical protein
MKHQKKRKLLVILVLVNLVLIFLLILGGCSEHKVFIFHNIFSECSFSYPKTYVITKVDTGIDNSKSGDVFLNLITNGVPENGLVSYIDISVMKTNEYYRDYHLLLEDNLKNMQLGQKSDELKIIDHSSVTTNSIQGEQIIYQYTLCPDPYKVVDGNIVKSESIPSIAYRLYFEKNDYIWNITIDSILERAEQSKEDFDYIIKSFKFLN